MTTYANGTLEVCEVPDPSVEGSSWIFERFGPFPGRGGGQWQSAAWDDAGKFESKLHLGDVYITAFGFSPTLSDGTILGSPPSHIHHMHVTASQGAQFQYLRKELFAFQYTKDGSIGVPFDVHGDRQCQTDLGGTDCLIRGFPTGFGQRITDKMWTFYDLIDERPKNSPLMNAYSEHTYRWSRSVQRYMGRFVSMIPSNLGGHDDYLLRFEVTSNQEYLVWSEMAFLRNATLHQAFWHTHHDFTVDAWAISATARQLGLGKGVYSKHHVSLNDAGVSMRSAMVTVLDNLAAAQEECRAPTAKCTSMPRARCTLQHDRWDSLEGGGIVERYHAPRCNEPWAFKEGEVYTLLAWDKAIAPVAASKLVWMHTTLYGLYTEADPTQPTQSHDIGLSSDLIAEHGVAGFMKSGFEVWHY